MLQNLNAIEQQHISTCIEENTEKLDLLEKTLALEQKQNSRLEDMIKQKEKEREQAMRQQLYEGSSPTTTSILNLEDAQRKGLMDALIRDSTPNAPVVKVLNNIQGTDVATAACIIN